jgi:hypothetical protein
MTSASLANKNLTAEFRGNNSQLLVSRAGSQLECPRKSSFGERMNALQISCKTARFNLSKVGEHFINPCCFGEDFAGWLQVKLIERNVQVRKPYQEDWGWELPAIVGSDSYYLCMSGNADGSRENEDEGEWNIIIEKKRSLGQRLRGKGKILMLEEILCAEPTIRDVQRVE